MNAYGPQTPPLKREFLESLNHLGTTLGGQRWDIGGDFNMITALWEKKEGARHLEGESEFFRDWIEKSRLIDIHTSNGPFTWTNKRRMENSIDVYLDIFLTFESLFRGQQFIVTEVLPFYGSDHWPMSLTWEENLVSHTKPFCLEKFWMDHQDFMKNIET
jgi:hypothetical protein